MKPRVTLTNVPSYPGDYNTKKVRADRKKVLRPDGSVVEVRKTVTKADWHDWWYRVDSVTVRKRMTLPEIRLALTQDIVAGVLGMDS